MTNFRFLDWKVYKDSKDLLSQIIKIVRKLPKEYRFEIGSQIVRSSLSVSLNIAEGSGKNSDTELNHYFNISSGSLNETLACLDILHYNKLITKDEFSKSLFLIQEIGSQLSGFKKSLFPRHTTPKVKSNEFSTRSKVNS